jgi:hypothetical protein
VQLKFAEKVLPNLPRTIPAKSQFWLLAWKTALGLKLGLFDNLAHELSAS